MKTTVRIKFLVVIAFALALAASLLVATKAGAQDRSKPPKDPPPTSYMPVIEEPFEVVRARDKANKPRVMAAAMRLLESRYDLTRRVDPDVKMTHGKAIPVGPTARLDLHPGPALPGEPHLCAGPQPGLQRIELPDQRLAARLG